MNIINPLQRGCDAATRRHYAGDGTDRVLHGKEAAVVSRLEMSERSCRLRFVNCRINGPFRLSSATSGPCESCQQVKANGIHGVLEPFLHQLKCLCEPRLVLRADHSPAALLGAVLLASKQSGRVLRRLTTVRGARRQRKCDACLFVCRELYMN